MRELSASEILDVWERGRGSTLPRRAVELLAAGGHPAPPQSVSVGERDELLVRLRELMFGPSLSAVSSCPSCAALVEVEIDAADLREERGGSRDEVLELELEGGRVAFRLPTAGDLVAVGGTVDVEEGRALLLERCMLEGELAAELDRPAVEAAVSARMAEGEPGAWIELALACPGCGREWSAPFDIVSFLCAELDACARRLVREVHALACAYGWSESDVLALSAERRDAYLELASG
jgi:hypothetical protein